MKITPETLPTVNELQVFSATMNVDYESSGSITESNAEIISVTVDNEDSGISIAIDNTGTPSSTVSGRYEQQFSQTIGYTLPQPDIYTRPTQVIRNSWSDVPEPDDPNLFFLFEYRPPDILSVTTTYTVTVDYDETDSSTMPPEVERKTAVIQVPQIVNYDVETNTAEFRRYV